MGEFLRDHARQNVWCVPGQDLQYVLRLARVSPRVGKTKMYRVIWENISLPDTTSTWAIFQIGGIHPKFFNLLPITSTWSKISDTCISNDLICDVYSVDNINLPRSQTFYRYGTNRNLIVAVKQNPGIDFDFQNGDVYMRLYSNAYYDTLRSSGVNPRVHVEGTVPTTVAAVSAFQSTILPYKSYPGALFQYVNGVMVKDIDIVSAKPGDVLEFVYDGSVAKKVSFRIGDLSEFVSTLDGKRKYLLHYTGTDRQQIDFEDDIDIVVMDKTASRYYGTLLNKNSADTIRNVTHRDYAIPVAYIEQMTQYLTELAASETPARLVDPMDMSVELYIRDSGFDRPLVNEDSRIHELYKLPDIDIQRAMLGIDSTVPFWRAEALENSAYTNIMRSQYNQITDSVVESAYGYNAIAKLTSYSPVFTQSIGALKVADVPLNMQHKSTAFEYDVNGVMLGYGDVNNSATYTCFDNTAHYVEFIFGSCSWALDDTTGSNNVPIPIGVPYRVYMCPKVAGIPSYNWVDVTGDTSKYSVILNKVVWTDFTVDPLILVRAADYFLCYNTVLDTMSNTKLLIEQIYATIEYGGVPTDLPLTVPFGRLDVFLNGKSLVRGIDYNLNGNIIVITNKEYLDTIETTNQSLTIRMYDFCKTDMSVYAVEDFGFVSRGVLSNNNKFDLRDDRCLRFTVNGGLKDISELTFYENTVDIGVPSVFNGKPYQMTEGTVPLYNFISGDTYALKDSALAKDAIIRDYMTLKYPIVVPTTPSAIAVQYKLYSPFINKVIYDTVNSLIDVSTLGASYTDMQVIAKVQHLEYLLPYDPIYLTTYFDSNNCIIHPIISNNTLNVSIDQYRFIDRVVKLYAKRSVLINSFLTVV